MSRNYLSRKFERVPTSASYAIVVELQLQFQFQLQFYLKETGPQMAFAVLGGTATLKQRKQLIFTTFTKRDLHNYFCKFC